MTLTLDLHLPTWLHTEGDAEFSAGPKLPVLADAAVGAGAGVDVRVLEPLGRR